MALPKMIEGTGEELQDYLKQAPQERFRLIHLPAQKASPPENSLKGQSLAEALKDYIGIADFGDANLSKDTGKKFAELPAQKHRKVLA
ncbi:MAG TPA: hypothetical protein VFB38_00250 [Chthonomonadaceae bacterium]|nr:hypothetical protein [Chthonomonadaceae bacterium]